MANWGEVEAILAIDTLKVRTHIYLHAHQVGQLIMVSPGMMSHAHVERNQRCRAVR